MNDEMFAELEASLKEGLRILEGKNPPSRTFIYEAPDVKAIRETLNLTQQQFAELLGISLRTVQNWEQGRRVPDGPAQVLLMVAEHDPQAIFNAIQANQARAAASIP